MKHCFNELICLFEDTFKEKYNTRLIKGNNEPLYAPANETCSYHQIIFAHGYYASALHEISHWCLAGAERRLLEDFGYWYVPDGRDQNQQQAFEQVELNRKPLSGRCVSLQGKILMFPLITCSVTEKPIDLLLRLRFFNRYLRILNRDFLLMQRPL